MWQVILFLAVAVGAYFILRGFAGLSSAPVDEEVPHREETAKEWAARVHGLVFNNEHDLADICPPARDEVTIPPTDVDPGDEWKRELDQAELPSAAGRVIEIDYVDGKDQFSRRRIRVNAVLQGYRFGYLEAFCFERRDSRTFRLDRVVRVCDSGTGLTFAGFMNWLAWLDQQRETISAARAKVEGGPAITVLMYLARIDGRFHPHEVEAVRTFMKAGGQAQGLPLGVVDALISQALGAFPRLREFEQALIELHRVDGAERAGVIAAVDILVASDERLDDREAVVAGKVRQLLSWGLNRPPALNAAIGE